MNEEINKELCQLLGICWHEPDLTYWDKKRIPRCKKCKQIIPMIDSEQNPDFTSDSGKVQLLREMYNKLEKRLFDKFMVRMANPENFMLFLFDNSGKLAIAARDFLRKP